MNRLLNAAIVASVVIAVALYAYYEWQPSDPGPPETQMRVPGPVEPVPKIEDHVEEVLQHTTTWILGCCDETGRCWPGECPSTIYQQQRCPACPDCPTWDALRRAGLEVICTNAFGEVPSVNYWPQDMPMACSKIKKVVVTDKRIEVERK